MRMKLGLVHAQHMTKRTLCKVARNGHMVAPVPHPGGLGIDANAPFRRTRGEPAGSLHYSPA